MRYLAIPLALLLSAAVAYGQAASTRVEILDTASETIDRQAFDLFRNSIRDALRADGYDAVLTTETLAGHRARSEGHDGYCIEITQASAANRIAGATGSATSATGGVMVPAWEGLATVEVEVLDARSSNVVATYKLSGIDTGLVASSPARGHAPSGAVFRPSDPLLGYLLGGIFNAGRNRNRDAVTAVARDVAMRMKEDLRQQ